MSPTPSSLLTPSPSCTSPTSGFPPPPPSGGGGSNKPFLWSDCFKKKKAVVEVSIRDTEDDDEDDCENEEEVHQHKKVQEVSVIDKDQGETLNSRQDIRLPRRRVRTTLLSSSGPSSSSSSSSLVRAVSTLDWEATPRPGAPRCTRPFPFMQVGEFGSFDAKKSLDAFYVILWIGLFPVLRLEGAFLPDIYVRRRNTCALATK